MPIAAFGAMKKIPAKKMCIRDRDILCKSLITSHSRVLAENPSYPVSLNAFLNRGAAVDTIPLEADGPNMVEFETILAKKKIDYFYTCLLYTSGKELEIRHQKLNFAKGPFDPTGKHKPCLLYTSRCV